MLFTLGKNDSFSYEKFSLTIAELTLFLIVTCACGSLGWKVILILMLIVS